MKKHQHSFFKKRRGYFTVEMALGLIILGVLLSLVISMSLQNDKGLAILKAKRDASRLADLAMLSLRAGGSADSNASVRVRALPDSSESPGLTWVEVTATVSGQSVSLIGLVPEKGVSHATP